MVFGGQVHLLEIAGLIFASFIAYSIGYSLPVIALFLLLAWPILLIQLVLQGLFEGIWHGLRGLYRRVRSPKPNPKPSAAPVVQRVGMVRYIWWLPLVALTAGYGRFVLETGEWFLWTGP